MGQLVLYHDRSRNVMIFHDKRHGLVSKSIKSHEMSQNITKSRRSQTYSGTYWLSDKYKPRLLVLYVFGLLHYISISVLGNGSTHDTICTELGLELSMMSSEVNMVMESIRK